MPLIVNGVTMKKITVNGVSMKTVNVNGVTVFTDRFGIFMNGAATDYAGGFGSMGQLTDFSVSDKIYSGIQTYDVAAGQVYMIYSANFTNYSKLTLRGLATAQAHYGSGGTAILGLYNGTYSPTALTTLLNFGADTFIYDSLREYTVDISSITGAHNLCIDYDVHNGSSGNNAIISFDVTECYLHN